MLQKYQDISRRDAADKVAMTIVRKEKKPGTDQPVHEKLVTLELGCVHFEDFPVLNDSEEILILVDEAQYDGRHAPYIAIFARHYRMRLSIGFTGTPILSKEKTETREIFVRLHRQVPPTGRRVGRRDHTYFVRRADSGRQVTDGARIG